MHGTSVKAGVAKVPKHKASYNIVFGLKVARCAKERSNKAAASDFR